MDAVLGNPAWHVYGNLPLFVRGGARRDNSAAVEIDECRDRQLVAAHIVHRLRDILVVFLDIRSVGVDLGCRLFGIWRLPDGGDVDLHQTVEACVDGFVIHVDDIFAFAAVSVSHSLLHIGDGVVNRENLRQLEESRLKNRVRLVAETDLTGDFLGVARVEADVVVRNILLRRRRQALCQFLCIPGGVGQENATGLDILYDIEALKIRRDVTGHKVRL